MSGVVAAVALDGRPVRHSTLRGMLQRMPGRRALGADSWLAPGPIPVGLGQVELDHVSVREGAAGPIAVRVDGHPVAIAGDVRLDARSELVGRLGAVGQLPGLRSRPDPALVLAAYLRWGEAMTSRLFGDFAVVIWDGRDATLRCFRDHLGVRPLYYHHAEGRVFLAATELGALLAHRDVRTRPCEARVADYLGDVLHDPDLTFYDGLYRVPAATELRVRGGRVTANRFWSPMDVPRATNVSESDCLEGFRHRFTAAVQDRLPVEGGLGCKLSGGVDSSSVACTAHFLLGGDARESLSVFSGTFEAGRRCDERAHIEAVLHERPMRAHAVRDRELMREGSLLDEIRIQGEPFFNPFTLLFSRLYADAATHGVRAMLDGFDGDAVAFQSFVPLRELLAGRRWLALYRAISDVSRMLSTSRVSTLRRHVLAPGLATALRARGRRPIDVLTRSLSERTDAAARRRRDEEVGTGWTASDGSAHARRLSSPVYSYALSRLAHSARAVGIQPRHPFLDRRLVEFMLALPSDLKLRRGWPRYPLRAALEGIVPASIRWRTDKAAQVSHFVACWTRPALEALEESIEVLEGWVSAPQVRRLGHRYTEMGLAGDAARLWHVHAAAQWRRHEVEGALGTAETGQGHSSTLRGSTHGTDGRPEKPAGVDEDAA